MILPFPFFVTMLAARTTILRPAVGLEGIKPYPVPNHKCLNAESACQPLSARPN